MLLKDQSTDQAIETENNHNINQNIKKQFFYLNPNEKTSVWLPKISNNF